MWHSSRGRRAIVSQRVVIIGSGLGGLSSGVILAKNGYDVTILEKQPQIGGCLQCFKRKGVKFETGMHFIGSAAHGQTLDKLAHYFEIDRSVRLHPLDPEGYDIVSFQGEQYKFAIGREPFIRQMAEYFPKERENLEHYYDLIEQVAHASSLHSLRHTETDAALQTEYLLRSINDVIDETISDERLRNVLVGNLPLYAAERDKTPFATHAFIMDFYNQSAFRIAGGSDNVATALAETLKRYGGKIYTRKEASEIVCDTLKALGVQTTDGTFFASDIIISDIHPTQTLRLVQSPLIRPAYRQRIENLQNTIGGFSVYLRFKKDCVPYMNANFYGYTQKTAWDCEKYDQNTWPKGYLYMHFCPEQPSQWAQSGVILSYMHFSEVAKWVGTKVGQRGEEYEQMKREKATKLLEVVSRDFPKILDEIDDFYTSTPLTYLDYTGTIGGSMYGIKKDITLGNSARVHHRTRIPNLLLTGQNINSHGMLGVLVGTIVTCSELIGSEEIFRQIQATNQN